MQAWQAQVHADRCASRSLQQLEPRQWVARSLAVVIDDLVASGDLTAKGRGKARRFRAKPQSTQQALIDLGEPAKPAKSGRKAKG